MRSNLQMNFTKRQEEHTIKMRSSTKQLHGYFANKHSDIQRKSPVEGKLGGKPDRAPPGGYGMGEKFSDLKMGVKFSDLKME